MPIIAPLFSRLALFASVTSLALASTACVIESSSSSGSYRSGSGDSTSGGSGTGGTTIGPSPVLVEVDTNAKLQADPGDGVGVFVEYATGGKWHVFWSCDTNQTSRTCDYQVRVRPTQNKLTDVVDDSGAAIATVGGEIAMRREIGAQNDGVKFVADPGSVITLEVTLDGQSKDVLFFFVQNGKLNGGYEGNLTNPIKLQGKTP
jgi:hypothetical protein